MGCSCPFPRALPWAILIRTVGADDILKSTVLRGVGGCQDPVVSQTCRKNQKSLRLSGETTNIFRVFHVLRGLFIRISGIAQAVAEEVKG